MTALEKKQLNDVVKSAKNGSGDSINLIIKYMRSTVEAISMKYIASPLEKDDLFQEGMIGLLAAIRAYNENKGASFVTFANICIDNSIQSALRKFSRTKDVPKDSVISLDDYYDSINNSAISAEDTFLATESVSMLTEVLENSLSKYENEVLRLHIIGCSYKEIATKLGKTPKAVDNALQRIRKKLYKASF